MLAWNIPNGFVGNKVNMEDVRKRMGWFGDYLCAARRNRVASWVARLLCLARDLNEFMEGKAASKIRQDAGELNEKINSSKELNIDKDLPSWMAAEMKKLTCWQMGLLRHEKLWLGDRDDLSKHLERKFYSCFPMFAPLALVESIDDVLVSEKQKSIWKVAFPFGRSESLSQDDNSAWHKVFINLKHQEESHICHRIDRDLIMARKPNFKTRLHVIMMFHTLLYSGFSDTRMAVFEKWHDRYDLKRIPKNAKENARKMRKSLASCMTRNIGDEFIVPVRDDEP